MTLRRVGRYFEALRWYDAPLWRELEEAAEAATKATPDRIRERQAAFKARNERRRAMEEASE